MIREHIQRYALGTEVTLYELDLTEFGLGVIRIVPATAPGDTIVSFGGEEYAPHVVKSDGWETTTNGSLPRPVFTVANLDNTFTALVEQNDDLHGAKIARIRTYGRYLDGAPEADGNSHKPIDRYELVLKTEHTEEQITWQCAASMDQEGVTLPGRKVTRDYCTHDTRVWNPITEAFEYAIVTCPYAGEPRDINGDPCAPEDEVFSKRLQTCCKARFGADAVLPTRAFPGVARIRAQ